MSRLCILALLLYNITTIICLPSKYDATANNDNGFNLQGFSGALSDYSNEINSATTDSSLENWTGHWMPSRPNEPTPPMKDPPIDKPTHTHHLPMEPSIFCDNGETNLDVDWSGSAVNYTCYGEEITPDFSIRSLHYREIIPFAYRTPLSVMFRSINGTFQSVPAIFKQLYSFHGVIDGHILPLVYALSRSTYYDQCNQIVGLAALCPVFNVFRRECPIKWGYSLPTATHKCMNETIEYDNNVPVFGTHRPMWPVYGEYKFIPKQRWLHSLEHGAVVMLYHPCVNPSELKYLKTLVKNCLRRHIISPYNLLDEDRPLVLITWGHRLSMSWVDPKIVKKFIRDTSLRGPENIPNNGHFKEGLVMKSRFVSTPNDSVVCPDT